MPVLRANFIFGALSLFLLKELYCMADDGCRIPFKWRVLEHICEHAVHLQWRQPVARVDCRAVEFNLLVRLQRFQIHIPPCDDDFSIQFSVGVI